jgi:hypothetical protein
MTGCVLDRSCSGEMDVLIVDSSHVYMLARGAEALAVANPTSGDRAHELISAHQCGGQHRLATSSTVKSAELNLADGKCKLHAVAKLPLDALDDIEALDDGGGTLAADGAVGDRDTTLVLVGEALGDNGAFTMLLTDDEKLYDWSLHRLAQESDETVSFFPRHSVEFLGELHRCNAISFQNLTEIADAQERHLTDWLRDEPFLHQKLQRIRRVMNRAALLAARRSQ